MSFLSKICLFFMCVSISNADIVDDVCGKIDNKPFCLAILKSDSRSGSAKDVRGLTTIAVDVATKNTTMARDYLSGVKTGPPGVLNSLKDCIASYDTVLANFNKCLKEKDCSLAAYDIHVAGDEVRRCQQIADANGAHDSFITSSNNVALDFCGLGESLANIMC